MRGLALAVLAAAGCTEFPKIAETGCGNSVVEPAVEDCDTIAPEGLTCAAPGEAHPCRFVCDPAAPACPPGWGCGADGVCRVASGELDDLTVNRFAALALETGDLNGDHAGDLVGLLPNRASILYGSGLGLFGAETNLGFGLASGVPVVGDLDQDGYHDLIVPTFLGIYVARGAAAPPMIPTAFAPLALPANVDVTFVPLDGDAGGFSYPGDEVLALYGGSVFFFDDSPAPETIASLPEKSPGVPWTAGELAGRVAHHKRGPGFPSVFLLAFRGAPYVYVYSVTTVTVNTVELPKPVLLEGVALPLGYVVADEGAQFLDVDDDTNLDIFVAVRPEAGGATKVATSRAQATPPFETPAVLNEGFRAIKERGVGGVICGDSAFPLAVTRQNNRFVIVGSNAVCRLDPCGPSPCYDGLVTTVQAVNATGAPWIEAFFADVNRDAFVDVAATSGVFSIVDVFITDGGRYNPFVVSIFDPASTLRHGDFDGDFVEDVALVEQGELSGRGASLSILYGKSQGAPEAPVSVGSFAPIVALEPGSIVKNPLFQNDAIDDLFVQFDDGEGEKGLTVLYGTSQRTLLSPFTLTSNGTEVIPTAALPAQLDGDGVPDLFAAAGNRLFFLRGAGGGALTKVADVPFDIGGASTLCTVWTAGRVGLSSTDLVIGMTGAIGSRTCSAAADPTPGAPHVVIVHAEGDGLAVTSGMLPTTLGLPVAPLLADLDDDGAAEMLVAIRGGSSPLRIFWSTDTGLALDDSHTAAPPLPTACAACSGAPFSVSVGNFDDDATPEVVLFADSGVWVLDVDPAARTVMWRPSPVIATDGQPFADGDVRLVDLDGDGVLDVAVSQAAVVLARRSVPLRQ